MLQGPGRTRDDGRDLDRSGLAPGRGIPVAICSTTVRGEGVVSLIDVPGQLSYRLRQPLRHDALRESPSQEPRRAEPPRRPRSSHGDGADGAVRPVRIRFITASYPVVV